MPFHVTLNPWTFYDLAKTRIQDSCTLDVAMSLYRATGSCPKKKVVGNRDTLATSENFLDGEDVLNFVARDYGDHVTNRSGDSMLTYLLAITHEKVTKRCCESFNGELSLNRFVARADPKSSFTRKFDNGCLLCPTNYYLVRTKCVPEAWSTLRTFCSSQNSFNLSVTKVTQIPE